MSDEVREQCDRLFMDSAPFVRAEQEAEDQLAAAQARLKAARAVFKATQAAAGASRRVWVDFMLEHDHRGLCLGRQRGAGSEAE
jgi:hypothetical protein